MDLAFDERKLLLPGVHDVTMDVVKQHVGRFQKSDRRMMIYAQLVQYVDALKKAAIGESIIIDGSFVMACIDELDDIDVILVQSADWDDAADLRPYQYNLVAGSIRKDTSSK